MGCCRLNLIKVLEVIVLDYMIVSVSNHKCLQNRKTEGDLIQKKITQLWKHDAIYAADFDDGKPRNAI